MARARNIKPAFFDNDELAELEPLARLLFIGLWTLSDFKGDLEWREKRIKKQLLAYDNCDIKKLAINLDKSGFIRFYSDGDKMYLNITNFDKHQNPHKNERDKGSEIPAYSESMRQGIDLKGLTINRDKSGLKRNDSDSNRADSLNLIPDSLNLIPDTPKSGKKPDSLDFSILGFSDIQIEDLKRIRKKNKGTSLTQRIINALAKEFHSATEKGYSFDELLTEWEVRGWKSFKNEWIKPNPRVKNLMSEATMRTLEAGNRMPPPLIGVDYERQ